MRMCTKYPASLLHTLTFLTTPGTPRYESVAKDPWTLCLWHYSKSGPQIWTQQKKTCMYRCKLAFLWLVRWRPATKSMLMSSTPKSIIAIWWQNSAKMPAGIAGEVAHKFAAFAGTPDGRHSALATQAATKKLERRHDPTTARWWRDPSSLGGARWLTVAMRELVAH